MLLLPGTSSEEGKLVAEKFRQRMLTRNLPHPASAAASCVTLSLGGATALPGDHEVAPDFFQTADSALYQAKSLGRNQVCWAADGDGLNPG